MVDGSARILWSSVERDEAGTIAQSLMRYKTNFAELTYEAHFSTPLFILAANPTAVLEALHNRLSPKYSIPSRDLTVDSARSVGELRAKVNLFAGRGTLEVSADSLVARFTDPRGANDIEVIKDCIQLAHDGLSALKTSGRLAAREETVTIRMFNELVDSPADARVFLRNLFPQSELYPFGDVGAKLEVVPGFHMELLHANEKWEFTLGLQRAVRSDKELFTVGIVRFLDGGRFVTLDEKAKHSVALMQDALTRLSLEPQPADPNR